MKIPGRKTCCIIAFAIIGAINVCAKKADTSCIARLRRDIAVLSADSLEGRRTGTTGEQKAARYIASRYLGVGLQPYLGHYRHEFRFSSGREFADTPQLTINGQQLALYKDFFPLPFSASVEVKAEITLEFNQQNKIWLMPLYQSENQSMTPHFDWERTMNETARLAQNEGATGIIFYDNLGSRYEPFFNANNRYDPVNIPVFFLEHEAFIRYIRKSMINGAGIRMSAKLRHAERICANVAAYIDNHSATTIVISAHYDHLGYGEDGNSLDPTARYLHKLHPGADDNASGVSALLEIARWAKNEQKLRNFNYLFVNFSGEELGLYGSRLMMEDEHLDSAKIACMINLDMVGRVDPSTHKLILGGIGTSPDWSTLPRPADDYLHINVDSSGRGPSDHTNFFNAGIPVLFFYSGIHNDYHMPSDVPEKINFEGEAHVVRYIEDIIVYIDRKGIKPGFTGYRTSSLGTVSVRVTLGIIPDYTSKEGGLRIDGVIEGKPASKAGLRRGDVIVKLGNYPVQSMQSYMEALDNFYQGDQTTVIVLRNGEEVFVPVELSGR